MSGKAAQSPSAVDIVNAANRHASSAEKAVYHFTKRDLLALAQELIELRQAAPHIDTIRLDHLASTGGHMLGSANGAPAVRIFGRKDWHADLRAAIDDDRRRPAETDDD